MTCGFFPMPPYTLPPPSTLHCFLSHVHCSLSLFVVLWKKDTVNALPGVRQSSSKLGAWLIIAHVFHTTTASKLPVNSMLPMQPSPTYAIATPRCPNIRIEQKVNFHWDKGSFAAFFPARLFVNEEKLRRRGKTPSSWYHFPPYLTMTK